MAASAAARFCIHMVVRAPRWALNHPAITASATMIATMAMIRCCQGSR
jgi:hypothetical protein